MMLLAGAARGLPDGGGEAGALVARASTTPLPQYEYWEARAATRRRTHPHTALRPSPPAVDPLVCFLPDAHGRQRAESLSLIHI